MNAHNLVSCHFLSGTESHVHFTSLTQWKRIILCLLIVPFLCFHLIFISQRYGLFGTACYIFGSDYVLDLVGFLTVLQAQIIPTVVLITSLCSAGVLLLI